MTPGPASDLGRVGLVVDGKFRLDTVIGRGAMGTVWAATHVNLGHRVAIKLVAREFVRSPEALRRFDAEAKAAARLQSRHVVHVYDSGTVDDGTPYIAMELLAGENLEERIKRHGPLPLHDAVQVMAQCCKALARAHAAGIVHRDIKPENVFLARAPDEDVDVVKILDFGVAKITMAHEGWTSSTGTGAMLGTPLYMSPEQVRASRDVDQRTDLYSLGLVAFTSLTGQLVVEGDTFGEVLLKICTQPLPSLRSLQPSLPPAMDAWFHRACARDPVDRYQNAQEFVDALRAAAGESAADGRATPRPTPKPMPPTLLSAQGGPTAPAFEQNPPDVAVTAASVSVTAAGVPRMRPGAVLAGVLLAALLVVSGIAWLVVSLHGQEPASAAKPATDTAVIARPADSGSVTLAALPPIVSSSASVSGVVDAGNHAQAAVSARTRAAAVSPPPWAPAPAAPPLHAPAAHLPPAAAPPANPPPKPKISLGY